MLLCGVSPAVQAQDSALSSGNHREIPLHLHFLRQEMGPWAACTTSVSVLQSCICSHAVCVVVRTKAACAAELQSQLCAVCRHRESRSMSPLGKKNNINTGLDFFGGPSRSSLLTISGTLELSGNTWEVAIPQ